VGLFYDPPGWATGIALAAALWGLLMALVLCIPVAAGALSNRRWPDLATGALVGAGAIYLGFYAASQDTYYSTPNRRWDSFSGHHWVAIAALVCTALAVIGLVAAHWARGRRRARARGAALFVAAVGFGLQLAGYIAFSLGH
jgi:hypothetical protein